MRNKLEMNILKALFIISLGLFINLLRKPPIKDWLLVFFLKSYFATFIDNLLVRKGFLKYPVNLISGFDISVLFSYLLFPISCVYFNQITKTSSVFDIVKKCLYFSVPSAIAEHFLERKTKLINYKKSWNSYYSFLSIAFSFLIVRALMGMIRSLSKTQ
ncbi:CBO0543 family protein [Robertmurraya beringensis]|uniref:CBO0543 family protein n=1 Tax=Robertmurraya beringensis TaxID=641660 RepID=A0ABV6KSA2_9BACI